MSIYRGAGGAGDAVNDSSSEAILVAQLVVQAESEADAAATSATNAAASASAAASSASAASTSASNAATAETNAETAETNAEAAQAAAEAAQLAAEAAQTAAELAETNAETAETNAETAQSAAATSATNANNSASAASTSATNASNSATAAAASATSAAASYDAFDDRYLGSKSSNPTVDNDGNALITGALYFNTTIPEMRLYNGTNWIFIGSGASAGVESFNTRTGAITLTSSDVTTALTYTPLAPAAIGTTVQAYDADLTTLGAGGSSARSFLGLAIGTDVQAYDADLAAFALKTAPTGDVIGSTDTQTLTNKTIALGSNTVSGTLAQFNTAVTDADLVSIAGTETLTNKTLTSPVVTGGSINNTPIGATTANTGAFTTLSATGVATFSAGTVSAPAITTTDDTNTGIFFPAADTIAFAEGGVEAMRISSDGEVAIGPGTTSGYSVLNFVSSSTGSARFGSIRKNYDSPFDMRIRASNSSVDAPIIFESSNATERMRIASDGQVSMSTGTLTVGNTAAGFAVLTLQTENTGTGYLRFADAADTNVGEIEYSHATNAMTFRTNDIDQMFINSTGDVGIGVSPSLAKLHISSSVSGVEGVYVATTGAGALFGGASPTGYVLDGTTGGLTSLLLTSTDGSSSGMNVNYYKTGGSPLAGDSLTLLRFYGQDSALNEQEYSRITSLIISPTNGSETGQLNFGVAQTGSVTTKLIITPTGFFAQEVYNQTTASSANVFVASNGQMSRSTSSIQYKTQVEDLAELNSANIYSMRPVWYRSTCANDNQDWSWYGLIAEEVAELDPRLVHWGYGDDQYDIVIEGEDDQKTEVKLLKEDAVLQPEGVQYDRLTVLLIQEMKVLKAIVDAQAARITALEGTA